MHCTELIQLLLACHARFSQQMLMHELLLRPLSLCLLLRLCHSFLMLLLLNQLLLLHLGLCLLECICQSLVLLLLSLLQLGFCLLTQLLGFGYSLL